MAVAERKSGSAQFDSNTAFALRYVVPGVVGSVLMTLGSFGVGWLPLSSALNDWPFIEVLRGTSSGSVVSKVAVFAGVALLLQSWLVLGFGVMHSNVDDRHRLWWTGAAWGAPLLLSFPMFSRDVYSYFAQGLLLVEGKDPYTSGVVAIPGWFGTGADPLWGESPAPYGPLFLVLERGVAAFVPSDPLLGAYVFRLIAVLGLLLIAWATPKLAYLNGISRSKALWLVVLNPLVFMHFIVGVHNDALMVGIIAVAVVVALRGSPAWAVALVALGASVKPIGLLAVPFLGLIWAGRRASFWPRVRVWVISLGITILVFVGLSLISRTGLGWLDALATPGKVRTWLSPPTALGMIFGAIGDTVGITSVDTMVVVFRTIGQLVAVLFIAWLLLKPEGRSPTRALGLAFMAVVLLGPVVQPWYLLWGLPMLVAAGLRRNEFRAVVLGTALLALHALGTSSSTQDTLFEISDGIGLVVAGLIVVVVAFTSPRERRLLLGAPEDNGLLPSDPAAAGRAASQVITGPLPETGSSGPAR